MFLQVEPSNLLQMRLERGSGRHKNYSSGTRASYGGHHEERPAAHETYRDLRVGAPEPSYRQLQVKQLDICARAKFPNSCDQSKPCRIPTLAWSCAGAWSSAPFSPSCKAVQSEQHLHEAVVIGLVEAQRGTQQQGLLGTNKEARSKKSRELTSYTCSNKRCPPCQPCLAAPAEQEVTGVAAPAVVVVLRRAVNRFDCIGH